MTTAFRQNYEEFDIDEPFIQPIGTGNDNENLDADYSRQLHDDLLSRSFDLNTKIPVETLFSQLEQSKRLYNKKAIQSIAASVAIGGYKVTGNEFIAAYIKRVRELRTVIEKTQQDIQTLQKTLTHAWTGLGDSQESQHTSNNGKLRVQVVAVESLDEDDVQRTYRVHLVCEDQVIETKDAFKSADGSVYFNEMFSFQANHEHSLLAVSLLGISYATRQPAVIGSTSIQLRSLIDQRKHDIVSALSSTECAAVALSCQWIFSKKQLYQDYVEEFSLKLHQKMLELEVSQKELRPLILPFGSEPKNVAENVGDLFSRYGTKLMDHLNLPNNSAASHCVNAIMFLLLFLSSFSRSTLLEQMIVAVSFWCGMDKTRLNLPVYSFLIVSMFFSVGIDVIWILYYSITNLPTDFFGSAFITGIMLCLVLCWKVIFVCFNLKCYYDKERMDNIGTP